MPAEPARTNAPPRGAARPPDPATAQFVNLVPIGVMSGGWLGPLVLFWLQVWGPMRPYDVAPVPAPSWPLVIAGLVLSAAPAWLPRWWYRSFRWERRGRVYEWLGVRWFKRLVPDGNVVNRMRRRTEPDFRLIRDRRSAAAFVARTETSEWSHLVLLVAGLCSGLWAGHVGWTGWAVFIHAGNVLVNVYPVLLQRYHRARIAAVVSRRDRGW